MSLLEQLCRWRHKFLEQMKDPAFVPLTREEFDVVVSSSPPYTRTERFIVDSPPKLFGIDVFSTPFAESMRQRQVDIPVAQVSETVNVATGSWCSETIQDYVQKRLTAYICHDTTSLKLTFEWDPLAAFKRKLRITKWFPIKTRTVTIDARVLYPYLKLSLPHNRHRVKFTQV